jgi:hypothetical protein
MALTFEMFESSIGQVLSSRNRLKSERESE